jgi:hypothetical protein
LHLVLCALSVDELGCRWEVVFVRGLAVILSPLCLRGPNSSASLGLVRPLAGCRGDHHLVEAGSSLVHVLNLRLLLVRLPTGYLVFESYLGLGC